MTLKATDPIVVPAICWTKQQIWEQLETDQEELGLEILSPGGISDEDAQLWVTREREIAFEAISNGEDYYGRAISILNKGLIRRTADKD